MPKFVKKPIQIEAIQFQGVHGQDRELVAKLRETSYPFKFIGQDLMQLKTATGWQNVEPGDFVIFGTHDVYPCKAQIFLETYEQVLEA